MNTVIKLVRSIFLEAKGKKPKYHLHVGENLKEFQYPAIPVQSRPQWHSVSGFYFLNCKIIAGPSRPDSITEYSQGRQEQQQSLIIQKKLLHKANCYKKQLKLIKKLYLEKLKIHIKMTTMIYLVIGIAK